MSDYENVTVEPAGEISQENKIQALLSYIYVLFLVPLLTKSYESSEFIKLHMNQGLLLFVLVAAGNIVFGVLGFIFGLIGLDFLLSLLLGVFNVATVALMVLGILAAWKGESKKLPIIGDLFTFIQ